MDEIVEAFFMRLFHASHFWKKLLLWDGKRVVNINFVARYPLPSTFFFLFFAQVRLKETVDGSNQLIFSEVIAC